MTIAGARQGRLSGLAKVSAHAMARDLAAVVIPGPEIARAVGLDFSAAGLRIATTPRDANVTLIIGKLAPGLAGAAAIVYAQMPRPRAVLGLGADEQRSALPLDIHAELSQAGLERAVQTLRQAFSKGAFLPSVADFEASGLRAAVEYVCPMHPDVVADEPVSCPKCGMRLVAREASGNAVGHRSDDGGHGEAPRDHANEESKEHDATDDRDHGHSGRSRAHHEQSHEGKHEPAAEHHSNHGHSGHAHGEMSFMSMVEVTKDLPRSEDGLPMDWIDVPFGPLFPGLPGGLRLVLMLDGDGVAKAYAESVVGFSDHCLELDASDFVEQLGAAMPLAPVAYRLLVCRALEQVGGIAPNGDTTRARVVALERERVVSHLSWLVQLAQQLGFAWLGRRATLLQRQAYCAEGDQLLALRPAIQALAGRVMRTPLLEAGLSAIGSIDATAPLRGPVARACGHGEDARLTEEPYRRIGFAPVLCQEGDALARLRVRLGELEQSLDLIEAAANGGLGATEPPDIGMASGAAESCVETPRGRAELKLTLDHGRVVAANLDTPCSHHIALVSGLTEQRELGDALVVVGSLDISPWEVVE